MSGTFQLSAELPTLYQYYTDGGITTGLSADQPYFTLNNRNISIYSGSLHYFRVPRQYWRDRLRKFRAAGLNAVETYVPWNLHEPQPGVYDFGDGGTDFQDFLKVEEFLKTAQEEDLLAIVRPGPYICGEWEFGGLPSWLLREEPFKVRVSHPNFMKHVTRFFNRLLPILAALQFTRGGPIVAFQVENEYGSTSQKGKFTPDKEYLQQLRNLFLDNGITELLFTSDSPSSYGDSGTLPGVLLQTANFATNPEKEFAALSRYQQNKPFMSGEFWTGWFDHWSDTHHIVSTSTFENVYERILDYPASVNMYMFIGGTSFGFLNGANIEGNSVDNKGFQPDTSSYDYNAPLTEAGDYTEKYVAVRKLLNAYNPVETKLPPPPLLTPKTAFPDVEMQGQLLFDEIIERVPERVKSAKPISMELLPINNGSGQSYGYIVYRKQNIDIPPNSVLKIGGRVCDTVSVLVNGFLVSKPLLNKTDLDGFGYWRLKDSTLQLGILDLKNATLELLVENWGRSNFGKLEQFVQKKGLWQGSIYLNNEVLEDWEIVPLEFKKRWNKGLKGWHKINDLDLPKPALYRGTLTIENPRDTFLDMSKWSKGIVIVNGFVLGRYASQLGPQLTLYLPAPLQQEGENEIIIFEHFFGASSVSFSAEPIYGVVHRHHKK